MDPIGTFSYAYVGNTGRASAVTYPNGQTTSYAYYPANQDLRLQEIHHKKPDTTTLSRFSYAYDAVGNIKLWTQQTDLNPENAYDFGYDRADQLTSAIYRTTAATPQVLKRHAYAYDPAGNRTSEQIDDAVTGASYDNMNRLTSQQPGGALLISGTVSEAATVTVQGKLAQVARDGSFSAQVQVAPGTNTITVVATDASGNVKTNVYEVSQTGVSKSFTYDANGNMTSDATRAFEWDAEDRLIAVNNATHRSEFTYDGKGRRVRIVDKDNAAVTSDRWFVWCDAQICEDREGGGAVVRRRHFPLGMQEDGASYYYAKDHLTSVRELTDAAGTLRARYEYDPYGRVAKLTGDKESPVRFSGHYFHESTALSLTWYRAYDSALGRWASSDPSGLEDEPNLYAYVGNSPINRVDPLGLAQTCWDKGDVTVTAVLSCNAQLVSAQGPGCGKNNSRAQKSVAELCSELKKTVDKKKKADLDPAECPEGQICTNKTAVTSPLQLVNETLNFSGCFLGVCCTATVSLTGTFQGTGRTGTCCQDPTGKKCK